MPLYDFRCNECGNVHTFMVNSNERRDEMLLECPVCEQKTLNTYKICMPATANLADRWTTKRADSDFKYRLGEIKKNLNPNMNATII